MVCAPSRFPGSVGQGLNGFVLLQPQSNHNPDSVIQGLAAWVWGLWATYEPALTLLPEVSPINSSFPPKTRVLV